MTPTTHPGLLGICLSGAGPTILALVSNGSGTPDEDGTITTDDSEITLGAATVRPTAQMSAVGNAIKELWKKEGIEVEWKALSVDEEGATLTEL